MVKTSKQASRSLIFMHTYVTSHMDKPGEASVCSRPSKTTTHYTSIARGKRPEVPGVVVGQTPSIIILRV